MSILDYIGAKDDGRGGNKWSYAKFQSNRHYQQTNTQFYTGRMTCRPLNRIKALKENRKDR